MDQGRRGNRGGGRNYRGSRGSSNRYVARPSHVGGNASTDHGIPSGIRNSETPSIDDAARKMNEPLTSDGPISSSHGSPNVLQSDVESPSIGQSATSNPASSSGGVESEDTESQQKGACFDICLPRTAGVVKLKSPLLVTNRAKRNELKLRTEGGNIKVLRTGMILLKGYLGIADQVKFTKICRDIGVGQGGFYHPGYRDGAKLNLKMMCLGRNWDPQTSSYCDERPVDGAKPPPIPHEYLQFVEDVIKESHSYLESKCKGKNPTHIIPLLSPDLCIINFYSQTGKLGLHQDKDESPESLRRQLPVVSLSIGDDAEFLYGDQRDVERAEKLVLGSGDVLIFGGEARHIFHGVTKIFPNTAPKALLDGSDLRPGRINLTFRQY